METLRLLCVIDEMSILLTAGNIVFREKTCFLFSLKLRGLTFGIKKYRIANFRERGNLLLTPGHPGQFALANAQPAICRSHNAAQGLDFISHLGRLLKFHGLG